MRQVADRLHDLFIFHARHFVQKDGKNDGKREAEHEVQSAENQGVFDGLIEGLRGKQFFEILETNPRACADAGEHAVFFKGNYQTAHRGITENDIPRHHRQKKNVRGPVLPESIAQALPARKLSLRDHPIIPSVSQSASICSLLHRISSTFLTTCKGILAHSIYKNNRLICVSVSSFVLFQIFHARRHKKNARFLHASGILLACAPYL